MVLANIEKLETAPGPNLVLHKWLKVSRDEISGYLNATLDSDAAVVTSASLTYTETYDESNSEEG